MKGCKLMGRKLYVGNLSFNTTDQMLQNTFSAYGEVTSATVIMDRDSGRSKGFGFVEFAQDADAQKAMSEMNGKDLDGRSLKVDEAKEPREREQRSGGFRSERRPRY
jgi:cold-inducible RNA-binding protein